MKQNSINFIKAFPCDESHENILLILYTDTHNAST